MEKNCLKGTSDVNRWCDSEDNESDMVVLVSLLTCQVPSSSIYGQPSIHAQ